MCLQSEDLTRGINNMGFEQALYKYIGVCEDFNKIRQHIDQSKSEKDTGGRWYLKDHEGRIVAVVEPNGYVRC